MSQVASEYDRIYPWIAGHAHSTIKMHCKYCIGSHFSEQIFIATEVPPGIL